MPDTWEVRYCLRPWDAADGPDDADRDGYTNVEEYLNGTEPATGCICKPTLFLSKVTRRLIFLGTFLHCPFDN